jgi:ABC-type Na+ efflux pump permease subunit
MADHPPPAWLVGRLTARDLRRNVSTWRIPILSSALFSLLFLSTAFTTDRSQTTAAAMQFSLAVEGDVGGATELLAALDASRFALEPGADAEQAVEDGDAALGVRLPPQVDASLAAGDAVELALYQRGDHNLSQEAMAWFLLTLDQAHGEARAGVDGALTIDEVDIADDDAVNRDQFARTYAALVAFIALGVITSVASILGGTRDRRGAEALLVLPLPRRAIATGVAGGACPLGVVQVSIGALGLLLVGLLPLPTLGQSAAVVAGAVPGTLLAAAMLTATCAALGVVAGALGGGSADSVGVGDLLAMPLAAIGVALLIVPDLPDAAVLFAVPLLGPLLLVREAVLGAASALDATLALAGTAAATFLLLVLGGRMLGAERNVRRV